jgi:hypothetical protein
MNFFMFPSLYTFLHLGAPNFVSSRGVRIDIKTFAIQELQLTKVLLILSK